MNIKTAAEATRKLVIKAHDKFPEYPPSVTAFHIEDLLGAIMEGRIAGEQAHYWLGWAQCALVHTGACELDDMKNINYGPRGDD